MTGVEFDSSEPSLVGDLDAQHEAVHQLIDLRDRYLPGSAEQ